MIENACHPIKKQYVAAYVAEMLAFHFKTKMMYVINMKNNMIDYDKLKRAHELAHEYTKQNRIACYIEVMFCADQSPCKFNIRIFPDEAQFYQHEMTIDQVIARLEELTTPRCKFKVGETVWCLDCDKNIHSFVVSFIHNDKLFHRDDLFVYTKDVYPSKKELIQAQIDYWEALR